MSARRIMSLTPELVALCHRAEVDPGPSPATQYLLDEDFAPAATDILSRKPPGPLWLFAYGSLMWKPEVPHVDLQRAVAQGWHRAFSMQIERFRASPENPGYMMCLDRGGACEGVVLRLPEEDWRGQIEKLLRREVSCKKALDAVRWIEVDARQGQQTALAFYAAPEQLENYQANRPLDEIAQGLASACGHWGSGADYLYNTVLHLEELGIHDADLWTLQDLVASNIRARHGKSAATA